MYDEYTGVSIHALLAECDIFWIQLVNVPRGFNPRTPCGVRLETLAPMTPTPQFQSTHSLRSATYGPLDMETFLRVSIHALLAECDRFRHPIPRVVCGFNPRTPCGVRQVCEGGLKVPGQFQSTHSLRSATMGYTAKWAFGLVSIHALLAECDSTYLFITSKHLRVSIHALLAECDHTTGKAVMHF